jgi:RNA 3'-terminal phosphate cyclase (ATP)
VDIGSLGSCTLVVQAVLPVMMRATSPSTFAIDGGTHVNFAPPYQSLVHVILPVIRRFGVVVKCNCPSVSLYRNGAPPSRRGRLVLSVTPSNALSPLDLLELGRIVSVHCWCASDAACSVAAAAAASACTSAAAATFSGAAATSELIISDEVADAVHRPRSLSACIGLFVVSSTGCVIGADRMLLNMLPNGAEGAAQTTDGLSFVPNIVAEVHAAVRVGACVDHHTCDQLPLFMSLAAGPSRVRVQPLSDHARSACAVASQFTGAVFHVEHAENGSVVLSCTPSLKLTRIHELKSSGIVDDMKAQVSAAAAECRASASVALDHLRLFVGNLDWTCTDEDLHRHMECAGAVSSARVVLNESNGRSKGYGTVEMATKEDALHAIQTLNNSALKGRKIRVQLDQKK